MNLLSIDPGLVCCGWARWHEGTLVRCGLLRTKEKTLEARIKAHAGFTADADILVIEKPEIYQQRFLKGDPRDLANLAAVVGGIIAAFPGSAHTLYPKQWKGQVLKEVSERRTLAKLTPSERRVVEDPQVYGVPPSAPPSLLNNMFDAIGLGLFFLQR